MSDASRARIFEYARNKPWELVEEIDHPAGRARAHDLVVDRAGTVRQSGTGTRAAMAPHTDASDVEQRRFARQLGELLQRGFNEHRYHALVVAAPPRFLGFLRKELSDPVQRTVRETVDKDLTHLDMRELADRLTE
ncbi:MAG: host attachment protein [Deltaproteobacteria bacterium]|nr:host attachment protein [Deltaproteobacteria bacterium]